MTLANYTSIEIQENNEPLVNLGTLDFILEPRYFQQGLSKDSRMLLRKGAAEKLLQAQSRLGGLKLKIWDAFRPREVQNTIYQKYWHDLQAIHPDWNDEKLQLEVGKFVSPPYQDGRIPPHATGGAVDLTVVNQDGTELDMGTPFDFFGPEAASLFYEQSTDKPTIAHHRKVLREAMQAVGFAADPDEWWHFDWGNQLWALHSGSPCAWYGEVREKKLLIIQNSSMVQPGLIVDVARERGIPYNIVDLEKDEAFPDVQQYGAVVVLGGSDSANDTTPKMRQELAKIQECLQLNIPYLGSCLGLQALVKAGGGQVVRSPVEEIGFRDPDGNFFQVAATDEGRRDPMLKGLENGFETFFSHGESVELAPDMQLLGIGKFCRNQIVKVGASAYGMQCHPELTPELFELWKQQEPSMKGLDQEQLQKDFEALREEYRRVGRQLVDNFFDVAGFKKTA